MKAKARAIGVDNTCNSNNLLFLDFDAKEPSSELLLQILDTHNHYLLFKTKNGYHVITLNPISTKKWKTELKTLENVIDKSFVRYSLKQGYSVVRISPKYSTKDNLVCSPAPQLIQVKELNKPYFISKQHYYLFKLLYNVDLKNAKLMNSKNLILHFYITGGE